MGLETHPRLRRRLGQILLPHLMAASEIIDQAHQHLEKKQKQPQLKLFLLYSFLKSSKTKKSELYLLLNF